MNDKMREALELIRKEDDEWGSLGVKAREMVDEALATPPTEQAGRVISHKLTGGPVYECESHEWGWGIRNRHGLVCKVFKPSKFEGQEERFEQETAEFRSVVEFIIAALNANYHPAVSLPNYNDLWNVLEEGRVPLRAFITEDAFNALIEDIQILYADRLGKPVTLPTVDQVKAVLDVHHNNAVAAERILAMVAERLGKPAEVDFSHWAKTQGFDAWSADHAAVLRNLKAYLKAEGVRVTPND